MQKKIFIVASFSESLLNFRLDLMLAWQLSGYEVIALAPRDPSVEHQLQSHHIRFISIPLNRTGMNPLKDFQLFLALKKWMLFEKPDIVFAYTLKPVIYASLAAYTSRVKRIFSLITGVGYVFAGKSLKSRFLGFFVKKILRAALSFNSKVFFQNQDNLNLFRSLRLIYPKQPVSLVNGSGVDCQAFSVQPFPQQLIFLMIARLLKDKGVYEYVLAAKLLKSRYSNLSFALVGWVDTNPEAIHESQLKEWVDAGVINYLGRLADVRPAIASASVYVLPSYHEGTPRTVLEAMAMGRPIITTDAPGCRETVQDGFNGYLVPVKNVEALAQAMEKFILSPELLTEMGSRSRAIAEQKYDVHKVNQSILSAMEL